MPLTPGACNTPLPFDSRAGPGFGGLRAHQVGVCNRDELAMFKSQRCHDQRVFGRRVPVTVVHDRFHFDESPESRYFVQVNPRVRLQQQVTTLVHLRSSRQCASQRFL